MLNMFPSGVGFRTSKILLENSKGVNIIGEEDGDDGSDGAKKDAIIEAQDKEVLSKTLPVDLQGVSAERVCK